MDELREKELERILKVALQQTGCDGDLCYYAWHEDARRILGEELHTAAQPVPAEGAQVFPGRKRIITDNENWEPWTRDDGTPLICGICNVEIPQCEHGWHGSSDGKTVYHECCSYQQKINELTEQLAASRPVTPAPAEPSAPGAGISAVQPASNRVYPAPPSTPAELSSQRLCHQCGTLHIIPEGAECLKAKPETQTDIQRIAMKAGITVEWVRENYIPVKRIVASTPASVRYCGHKAPIGEPCPICYPGASTPASREPKRGRA
jgi:hypothetical protein